ncbi:MAG: hypothetical protein EOP10_24000 [Proteobacteria bacterium]|nr:MAG: hypothetical protein EOP10_24000 [Pseudomonadota bacterium]
MSKTEGMQIYNVVDREPAPRDEVVAWVAGALGMDVARYPRDESKAEPRSNKRVLSTKLQERGYSYIYPSYREGYAPLLATI